MQLVRRSEKRNPYYFAGRKTEFGLVRELALDTIDAAEHRANTSPLLLVSGMPGIGKTHFLARLTEELSVMSSQVIHAEFTMPDQMANPAYVFDALYRNKTMLETAKKMVAEMGQKAAAFALDYVSGGAVGKYVFNPKQTIQSDDVHMFLTKTADQRGFWNDRFLLITIDESQAISESGAIKQIRTLQNGVKGVPMMVVCAGLTNLESTFKRLDISPRNLLGGDSLRLPLLSIDDAFEAVSKGVPIALAEMLGDSNGDVAAESKPNLSQLRSMAAATDGFPRNIQHLVGLVAEHIIQCAQRTESFDQSQVMRNLTNIKNSYYDRRMLDVTEKFDEELVIFLGTLFRRAPKQGLRRNEVIKAYRERGLSDSNARVLIEDCVHAGIVQMSNKEGERHNLVPAIPSFVSRLVALEQEAS